LLEFVEEPFDQIARAIEVRAEAYWVLAIAFRRDVCPRAFLTGQLPDPVGIISSICQQHRSRTQSVQKFETKPVVVRFSSREAEVTPVDRWCPQQRESYS
jgi:hypothetical protein